MKHNPFGGASRRLVYLVLAVMLLLAPRGAQAQALEMRPGIAFGRAALHVCGGDIARLCTGVVPGNARIAQCLVDQFQSLSPDCRQFVGEAKSVQASIFACAADARRLCAGTLPGGGRLASCLSENRAEISRQCAQALDEASSLRR